MIRLKCPQCATPQSLDDEEAGSVAECDECGAKFRVPAAKVPARSRADDDEDEDEDEEEEDRRPKKKKKAAAKRRDDDDDDDDEPDEDEIERQKRLAKIEHDAFMLNIQMTLALVGVTIMLGVGGIFLNRVAIYTMIIGGGLMLLTMIMVSAMAKAESTMWFLLTRVVPGMITLYAILHWEQTKRYVIVHIAGVIIAGVGLGAFFIYEGKKIARRAIILERVKTSYFQPPPLPWQVRDWA